MKRVWSVLLAVAVLLSLCSCARSRFEDEAAMRTHIENSGIWCTEQTYGGEKIYTKIAVFSGNEAIFTEISRDASLSFTDYCLREIKAHRSEIKDFYDLFSYGADVSKRTYTVEYDYETGQVLSGERVVAAVDEAGHLTAKGDSYDDTEGLTPYMDAFADAYATYFEETYGTLPTAKDVQYNKYSYIGRTFSAVGSAELDDYYNWFYKDLDFAYFCVRFAPVGGAYSDEWYLYGDCNQFADLFEQLKKGSIKNIVFVSRLYAPDTGTNHMATIVDYFTY